MRLVHVDDEVRPHLPDLVHVVDPMQTETVTPERTYYRLHGTTGSRHVHSDEELHGLRDLVDGRDNPYVLFNNLPRSGSASCPVPEGDSVWRAARRMSDALVGRTVLRGEPGHARG